MFGKNEIVGKRFFANAGEKKLLVTSMFMTLQGEGPFSGEPAFFIRLAKCNLNCTFCDTFFDDGEWLTYGEINRKITSTIKDFYAAKNLRKAQWALNRRMVLVVTGGEPALQDNLNEFLVRIGSTFKQMQIETNGTLALNLPKETIVVVSPKCSEKKAAYLQPKEETLRRADCLKFVMCADRESPYSDIPDWAHDWADATGRTIYISPMNVYNLVPLASKRLRSTNKCLTLKERSSVDEVVSFWEEGLLDRGENQRNHEYAAAFCTQNGYTFNLQMHLYASLA